MPRLPGREELGLAPVPWRGRPRERLAYDDIFRRAFGRALQGPDAVSKQDAPAPAPPGPPNWDLEL